MEKIVPKKKTKTRKMNCYGIYFFFGILPIHKPRAKAKAPIITPTTSDDIPKDAAKTARAPAPTVQSGQWAKAIFGISVRIDAAKSNDFFIRFFDFIYCIRFAGAVKPPRFRHQHYSHLPHFVAAQQLARQSLHIRKRWNNWPRASPADLHLPNPRLCLSCKLLWLGRCLGTSRNLRQERHSTFPAHLCLD